MDWSPYCEADRCLATQKSHPHLIETESLLLYSRESTPLTCPEPNELNLYTVNSRILVVC
jgi:hypothetical protein